MGDIREVAHLMNSNILGESPPARTGSQSHRNTLRSTGSSWPPRQRNLYLCPFKVQLYIVIANMYKFDISLNFEEKK